ncbi:hypothetical protein E4T39_03781 [Aureobasidium subglaciale]|nr:hypothetical protein E4T39_03781 [Aureobasidium subglaciale]
MSSNATPTTTTTAPPLSATPTHLQPPLPPPQTFDILPPLHALLSRLEPSLNVYTPDTSTALPPGTSAHTPIASASALPSSAPQQLEYKDAAVAAQFLKSRIRKALAELGGLADMQRGVEEQEEEIRGLEEKIKRQRDVLARLAGLAEVEKEKEGEMGGNTFGSSSGAKERFMATWKLLPRNQRIAEARLQQSSDTRARM